MRALLLILILAIPAFAVEKPIEIALWPGVAPGEKGDIPEESFLPSKPGEKPSPGRLGNVSKPTITVYKPKAEIDTGAAIIIAPGGGYSVLAWEHEGTMVAQRLNKIGVTGVLLKYRVPRRPDAPKDSPAVWAYQDAQRAVGIVRSKAKEWKLDDQRIGMLGFSAGGHLTAWTSTDFTKRSYDPVDEADKLSSRPDFAVLIYAGGMLDKDKKLRPELKISRQTPPCFLATAYNDDGPFAGAIEFAKALKENKVNAELHVFSSGGHGFGLRPGDKPYAAWPARCEEWMKELGLLKNSDK